MSEPNRDETTGQFTSEPGFTGFGREGIERAAGNVPLKDLLAQVEPEANEPAEATLEDVVEQRAQSRTPESEIKTYSSFNLPDNVALTVKEAAELKSLEDAAERHGLAEVEDERIRAEIDELRGVKPAEEASKTVEAEAEAERSEEKSGASEVEKLLAHPEARQTFDSLTSAYQQGIDAANIMARAGLVETIPDILSLPPEHQAGAFAALAQSDPARYAKAAGLVDRANQLTALHQEQQRAKTAAEEREFSEFARAESTAFNEMIKNEPKAKVREVESAIIESIKEYGGDDAAFFELFKNTKILHSRVAQRLLYDAGQYRLMKTAAKAISAKPLPPVSRPGVSGAASSHGRAESVANLQQQLAGATGNKAIEIAAKLTAARRGARG